MIHHTARNLQLVTHSAAGIEASTDPSRIRTPRGYKSIWVLKKPAVEEEWLDRVIELGAYVELRIHVERGMGAYSEALGEYDEGFRYGYSSQAGLQGPRNPLFHIPPREEWGRTWGE